MNPEQIRGPGRPKEIKKRQKPIQEIVRNKAQKRKRDQVMPCPKGTDSDSKEPEPRRSIRLKEKK